MLADLRDGWREFSSRQWIWVVVAQFSVLVMALQAGHGVLGPLVAKESLGGAAAWSAFLAGEAVGTIGGVFVSLRCGPAGPSWSARCSPAHRAAVRAARPGRRCGRSSSGRSCWASASTCSACCGRPPCSGRSRPSRCRGSAPYDALGSLMFGPVGLMLAGPVATVIGPQAALLGLRRPRRAVHPRRAASPGVRGLRAPIRSRRACRAESPNGRHRRQTTISVTTTPAQLPATQRRTGTWRPRRPSGAAHVTVGADREPAGQPAGVGHGERRRHPGWARPRRDLPSNGCPTLPGKASSTGCQLAYRSTTTVTR